MKAKEHVISVTVENHFGMLARISGLFSARGYNINSLVVAPTEEASVSRMVLTASGDERIIEQIVKQLNKLIGVIKVVDFSEGEYLEREMLLTKVKITPKNRAEVLQLTEVFQGRVIDINRKYLTIELVGEAGKIDGLLDLLKPYGLKEVIRTGKMAISREHGE